MTSSVVIRMKVHVWLQSVSSIPLRIGVVPFFCMRLVVITAPLWTGALTFCADNMTKLGLLPSHHGDSAAELCRSSWTVLFEPAPAGAATSVDDYEDAEAAARKSSLVLYKGIASALVASDAVTGGVVVVTCECTHRDSDARRRLIEHVRVFTSRGVHGAPPGDEGRSDAVEVTWMVPVWPQAWCGPPSHSLRRAPWLSS